MKKKLWIGLEGMEFKAFHGVYDEERQLGGIYVADVLVYTDASGAMEGDDLGGTINYEKLYSIVSKHMEEPVKLIEHLAYKILQDVRVLVGGEDKIRVKIRKLQPPVGKGVAAAIVELED